MHLKIDFKKDVSVIPEFIELVLKTPILQKQIKLNYIQTTIPKMGLDRIENLFIPQLPSIQKQKECIDYYNSIFQTKQQNQTQAKELLASIDTYLLNELGIEIPEKDNSLKNRIFTTSLSEISGGRFDPFYLTNCLDLLISTKFEETELHNIAKVGKGQSITSSDVVNGKYPVIAGGQSSPYNHNKYNQKGNTITISASGAYSGFVWFHNEEIFASDCSVIQSKNEENISTKFIFNLLKLKQQEIYNLQQGSGQPHVYPSDIKRIKIPLPSANKQEEINIKITEIRKQAKQLELEAEQIMLEAKAEVEHIILGE
jgi:Restriction endonuclease S subunits